SLDVLALLDCEKFSDLVAKRRPLLTHPWCQGNRTHACKAALNIVRRVLEDLNPLARIENPDALGGECVAIRMHLVEVSATVGSCRRRVLVIVVGDLPVGRIVLELRVEEMDTTVLELDAYVGTERHGIRPFDVLAVEPHRGAAEDDAI